MGLGLAVFAWTLMAVDWPRVVAWGFRLRGVMAVEELAVLAPYLLGQVLAWCGLYRAERALRPSVARAGFLSYLVRKARQSLGLILPVALMYVLGRDLLRWQFPTRSDDPTVQFVGMATVGTLVFVLSPAFVRLTWPTRTMEPGPLRDRLERLSRRLRFRCSDIRVWDTGGSIVNAGVTGAVPWFRYVLITDAMIQNLDDHEIEAVFGHEVGHIAHRHLPFFALFFLGSTGAMSLAFEALGRFGSLEGLLTAWKYSATVAEVADGALQLAVLAAYFVVVFGFLSRKFERQADVYGCRAVSCGRTDCPPHADLNAPEMPFSPIRDLCPVGIRTFANALSEVAALNGMSERSPSWRHGSIARRIAFLEGLEGSPGAEKRFQTGVSRLRWSLALVLAIASAAALALAGPAG